MKPGTAAIAGMNIMIKTKELMANPDPRDFNIQMMANNKGTSKSKLSPVRTADHVAHRVEAATGLEEAELL